MLPTVEQRLNKAAESVYEEMDTHYALVCLKASTAAFRDFWADVWVEWLKNHDLDDLRKLFTDGDPSITSGCLLGIAWVFLGDASIDGEQAEGDIVDANLRVVRIEVRDNQFVNLWFKPLPEGEMTNEYPFYLGCINEGDFTGSLYQYTMHYQMTK